MRRVLLPPLTAPAAQGVSPPRRGGALARRPLLYAGLALLFSFLWASAFIAVKAALDYSPPLFLMGSRFLVAGSVLLFVARLQGERFPTGRREWVHLVVLGLLNQAAYLGISAIGLRYLAAGMGAVLASTNPLMLAAVAALVLRERLGPTRILGLGVAFGSVALVMSSRLGVSNEPVGMVLLLVGNAAMVAGTILFKRWAPPLGLTVLNGTQLLVASVALLVPSALFEPVTAVRLAPGFLVPMAYLAFGVSCGAVSIWFALLLSGDASKASAYLFLNPLIGLALGALLLGEALHPLDLLGGIGVGLGVYLVQRAR
jgi:drug/metabolite transporter (DMT)-like permease